MASILEQYRIADFLEWHEEGKLSLNPDFQRGPVWTPAARTYLIDTILNQLPVPKLFLRSSIDVRTKATIREVVDGQQRLRAIIDFANDRFTLSQRSTDFSGLRYSTLSEEQQQVFLGYAVAVDQLVNASDDDVLEVFARLNSYSVPLNAPEKRHAKWQGDFKWSVRSASRRWQLLWDKYNIVSVSNRVRMFDDSLMAEMFGILLEGVKDGGQDKIEKLYKKYDSTFEPDGPIVAEMEHVIAFFDENLGETLSGTPLLNSTHFLMLFSALAHALHGIPEGDMGDDMPSKQPEELDDLNIVRNNLFQLAAIIDSDEPAPGFEEFRRASRSTTQRIASRRIRFPMFYRALLPEPL